MCLAGPGEVESIIISIMNAHFQCFVIVTVPKFISKWKLGMQILSPIIFV